MNAQSNLLWWSAKLTKTAALLLETECSLHRRCHSDEYAGVQASITPVLETVRANVLEFERLLQ